MRLGFAYVRALGPAARAACDDAVNAGANTSVVDFWRHTLLPRKAMENLVQVGAFDAVADGKSRRQLLWELKAIEESLPSRRRGKSDAASQARSVPLPTGPPRGSGAMAGRRLGDQPHVPRDPSNDPLPPLVELPATPPQLPDMDERTRVNTEYALTAVSTGPHLISFMRERLDALGCVPLGKVRDLPDGAPLRVAGLVITRQAPVSASGFRFFTLADGEANLDVVFRPDVAARTREVSRHPILMIDGTLQVERGRVNVVVRLVTALDGDGRLVPRHQRAGPSPSLPQPHNYR